MRNRIPNVGIKGNKTRRNKAQDIVAVARQKKVQIFRQYRYFQEITDFIWLSKEKEVAGNH